MEDIGQIVKDCLGFSDISEALERLTNLEDLYDRETVVAVYNRILQDKVDSRILEETIRLSDNFRDKSTLPVLVDILLLKNTKDENEIENTTHLRVLAAKAISNYKDTSVVGSLLYCLNNKNEDYKIRLACADALGRIGDKYAVTPLINIVKDEDEKSIYVKESATFALGLIGDTSAIDPLVAIMDAKQGILDKFSFLKEKIVEALGRLNLNNRNLLRVFKSALSDSSPFVRINAIEALMNSDYEETPELIRGALHDEDEEVQRNALIALYNLIGRDILDEVISLPSYSEFLKQEAKDMLLEYEDDEE